MARPWPKPGRGAKPPARKPLKKAVLPVAGLGTRFLPATKVLAKEMLPVVDKPLIQYAIEEARAAEGNGADRCPRAEGMSPPGAKLRRHCGAMPSTAPVPRTLSETV
jgi:hypothetical protein